MTAGSSINRRLMSGQPVGIAHSVVQQTSGRFVSGRHQQGDLGERDVSPQHFAGQHRRGCAKRDEIVARPGARSSSRSAKDSSISTELAITDAVLRLSACVLIEAHGDWQDTADRRYLSEQSMALLTENKTEEVAKPELMTA